MNRYPLALYPIDCARCGGPAPIHVEELTGDGPGPSGAAMPVVVVPPAGWIADPDDGIICCATPEEVAEYTVDLAYTQVILVEQQQDDDEAL